MPPKKIPKSKLHQLAAELPLKTVLSDASSKKQYCVGKQFATGGFGRIYLCNEVGSKKELVVKVEPYGNGPLFTEVNVFRRIFKPEQIAEFMKSRKLKRLGVPPLISSGTYEHKDDKLRFLVMPKYATSLEAIREKSKTLSAANVWTIARCMLESLDYIHDKSYVHADIKAANILLERANDFATSVLADYGLARMSSSNEDKPDKKRAHNGTAIFTSCDAHRGCQPSYRGDLEILAYNLLYWLNGTLPWESFETAPEKVYEMKKTFLKDLSSSLRKTLQNNTESIAPLQEIFNAASKTGYDQQLDFSKLYKIVDDALKRASKSGQKRAAAEDNVETKKPKAVRSREVKRNVIRPEREEQEDDGGENSVGDAIENPQSPHDIRMRKRKRGLENDDENVGTATTSNGGTRAKVRVIRKEPEDAGDFLAVDVEEKKQTPKPPIKNAIAKPSPAIVAAQQRKRKLTRTTNGEKNAGAVSTPSGSPASPPHRPTSAKRRRVLPTNNRQSSRRSPRLSSVQVIPGKTVTMSPILSPRAKSTRKNNGPSSTPSNGTKARANVSSAEKRSPSKLGKIPGMQNFQHGRGSIVIKQITKKYQRLAQQKRTSH